MPVTRRYGHTPALLVFALFICLWMAVALPAAASNGVGWQQAATGFPAGGGKQPGLPATTPKSHWLLPEKCHY